MSSRMFFVTIGFKPQMRVEKENMAITTDMTAPALEHAKKTIPENTPIVVLNLLSFHETADYHEDDADFGISGRAAYFERYLPAFGAIAAKSEETCSIHPSFIGAVVTPLIAPEDEPWDVVALVEYPDFKAFLGVVESVEYRETAEPHRLAALRNLRLIVTATQPIP